MKISDRITGLFLAALGLAAFWGGSWLPPVPGQQVGPSVFPMVIGTGLMVLGVLIALHVGRSFEEQAEAEMAAHSVVDPEEEQYAAARRWMILLPPGLLVLYYVASEKLGFVPLAAFMIAVLGLAFGAKRKPLIFVSIGGAIFIQLIFVKLLRVPLPAGLLPMPW